LHREEADLTHSLRHTSGLSVLSANRSCSKTKPGAHRHAITEPIAIQRMLYAQLEKMFADGVSWLNIGIGVALLVWVWRSK